MSRISLTQVTPNRYATRFASATPRFGQSLGPLPTCDKEALGRLLNQFSSRQYMTTFSDGAYISLQRKTSDDVLMKIDHNTDSDVATYIMSQNLINSFQNKGIKRVTITYHINPKNGEITGYDSDITFIDNYLEHKTVSFSQPHPNNITFEDAHLDVVDAIRALQEKHSIEAE